MSLEKKSTEVIPRQLYGDLPEIIQELLRHGGILFGGQLSYYTYNKKINNKADYDIIIPFNLGKNMEIKSGLNDYWKINSDIDGASSLNIKRCLCICDRKATYIEEINPTMWTTIPIMKTTNKWSNKIWIDISIAPNELLRPLEILCDISRCFFTCTSLIFYLNNNVPTLNNRGKLPLIKVIDDIKSRRLVVEYNHIIFMKKNKFQLRLDKYLSKGFICSQELSNILLSHDILDFKTCKSGIHEKIIAVLINKYLPFAHDVCYIISQYSIRGFNYVLHEHDNMVEKYMECIKLCKKELNKYTNLCMQYIHHRIDKFPVGDNNKIANKIINSISFIINNEWKYSHY